MINRTILTVVAVLFALSGSAGAALVTIVNPGFEIPVLADGHYSNDFTDCPGWREVDAGTFGGVWNPGLVGFPGYGGNAPEGENIAYVYSGTVGIEQVLTETLTADMIYTLTVKVGNNLTPIAPWTGYTVQLLAGGNILAEDDNSLTIASDTFETSTVVYAYDSGDTASLGQSLKIRLLSLGPGEADFDDVQLTVIPEPATMGLLGMGALALIRRKHK